MVDVESQVVVHGRESHVVLQVFGEEAAAHHVEVESVGQLHVDIAQQ